MIGAVAQAGLRRIRLLFLIHSSTCAVAHDGFNSYGQYLTPRLQLIDVQRTGALFRTTKLSLVFDQCDAQLHTSESRCLLARSVTSDIMQILSTYSDFHRQSIGGPLRH